MNQPTQDRNNRRKQRRRRKKSAAAVMFKCADIHELMTVPDLNVIREEDGEEDSRDSIKLTDLLDQLNQIESDNFFDKAHNKKKGRTGSFGDFPRLNQPIRRGTK